MFLSAAQSTGARIGMFDDWQVTNTLQNHEFAFIAQYHAIWPIHLHPLAPIP